ncbi:MAG: hypothetical protein GF311_27330 [Candidatus Lokiarchaeota archaeon]|nr:hypothetical protein [Candidatus Lokiarchaeota archaeon]
MNKKILYIFFLIISIGGMMFPILFHFDVKTSKFYPINNFTSIKSSQFTLNNATVISDDSTLWNNDTSQLTSIVTDYLNNVHVVWQDDTDGIWGSDREIMYCNYTNEYGWSNATVISDDATLWNNGISTNPSIAVDSSNNLHVVWKDTTIGTWGSDAEIFYCNYTNEYGWSNATVISDDATNWNNGNSYDPEIAIDYLDNLHVVWRDRTVGWWGGGALTDEEIMYCNFTVGTGWSNASIISDDFSNWNTGNSYKPSIAVDSSNNLHVVWYDHTIGTWGSDAEIFYCNYTSATGWSNATVISDDATNWNTGSSYSPSIVADTEDNLHVVWHDETDGWWGDDTEIMYCNYVSSTGWSNASIISDDFTNWNNKWSGKPSIAIDSTDYVHVSWYDLSDGSWGTDTEIMYSNYTSATGWSNASVISDDATGWNTGNSYTPSIAVDSTNKLHVVWHDDTNGTWGKDTEIMYIKLSFEDSGPNGNGGGDIPGFQLISLIIFSVASMFALVIISWKKSTLN